ncbi:hypothetical protein CIB48_g978 [Xylaria polymorpha]|nr:hypothetical protein CIB48_g978 [Xylaria polymorpha]
MVSTKGNQQEESGHAPENGNAAAPPAYDDSWQEGSQAAAAATATDSKRSRSGPQDAAAEPRPTVDSPFNFPPAYTVTATATTTASGSGSGSSAGPSTAGKEGRNYSDLPEVVIPSGSGSGSSSSSSSPRVLIAIPQVAPQPTSPFLSAYNSTVLLRRGVPQETFTSFLSTLSAFLAASISEQALSHVGDVGRSLNDIPKRISKDTVAHVKGVGQHIGQSAKKGNFIAAGIGALSATVAIPVAAALRIVDATVHQLPLAVGGGLSRKPLSPRERAGAYVAVAQKDWFAARGLAARLCNTTELLLLMNARHRGGSSGSGSGSGSEAAAAKDLVNLVHRTWEMGPEGQLQALQSEFGFAPLEITGGHSNKEKPLDIGTSTLWLVLIDASSET